MHLDDEGMSIPHDCEDGWVAGDTIVKPPFDGERREYPTVEPCGICRPGRRAIFERKLDHRMEDGLRVPLAWNRKPASIRVYVLAEEAVGHVIDFDAAFPAFKGKRRQIMAALASVDEQDASEDGEYE